MLDRQKGDIVWQCDDCADTLETETGNFESARNMLKREGWRTMKVGEEWEHYCPKCAER